MDSLLPWLGGIFEGEGCIGTRSAVWGIIISVSQCNPYILIPFKDRYGGNIQYYQKDKGKPFYKWILASKPLTIVKFLQDMTPYLCSKKRQAELGLELYELYAPEYNVRRKSPEIKQKMQELLYLIRREKTLEYKYIDLAPDIASQITLTPKEKSKLGCISLSNDSELQYHVREV